MNIGILISGRGSNMLALADAIDEGRIPGSNIAVVISDHGEAPGVEHAIRRGIPALAIERQGRPRLVHDREILTALKQHKVDLVCLAGYMRLLSTEFIEAFRGRILNIHPSLLPSFPGLEPQRQALEHGVKWTGCTVHFVDETLDGGPIVAQQPVAVLEEDTAETLAARILVEEHKIYPAAVASIAAGECETIGRRVVSKRTQR